MRSWQSNEEPLGRVGSLEWSVPSNASSSKQRHYTGPLLKLAATVQHPHGTVSSLSPIIREWHCSCRGDWAEQRGKVDKGVRASTASALSLAHPGEQSHRSSSQRPPSLTIQPPFPSPTPPQPPKHLLELTLQLTLACYCIIDPSTAAKVSIPARQTLVERTRKLQPQKRSHAQKQHNPA